MGWVDSHIANRSAYEFIDEYQKITADSTLNFTGNHSIGITFKPKLNQTSYALLHKGTEDANPEYAPNGTVGSYNTLYMYVHAGFLYLRLFFNNTNRLFIRTANNIINTSDVTHVEYTWFANASFSELLLYVNGVSQPFIIDTNGSYYETFSTNLPTSSHTLFNSDNSPFIFGKSTLHPQFEGIIYDAYLYKKNRTPLEVSSTYNQVKDPSIVTTGEKIMFTSTRSTSPAKYRIWIGNNKLNAPTLLATASTSISNIRPLVSSNNTLNNTKFCWVEETVGLIVANRDGGLKTIFPIISSMNGINYTCPVIHPEGNKIYFNRFNNTSNRWDLCLADLHPTTNIVSNATVLIAGGTLNYHQFDIKPDGTKIICRTMHPTNGTDQLVLMNIDGTNQLVLQSFSDPEDVNGQVRFNKAGTLIGFSRKAVCNFTIAGNGNTTASKIYTMTATGGNLKQLEGDAMHCYFGSFSPDGSYIVYYTLGASGNYQVYKMDLNGRNKQSLSLYNGFDDSEPVWLPS